MCCNLWCSVRYIRQADQRHQLLGSKQQKLFSMWVQNWFKHQLNVPTTMCRVFVFCFALKAHKQWLTHNQYVLLLLQFRILLMILLTVNCRNSLLGWWNIHNANWWVLHALRSDTSYPLGFGCRLLCSCSGCSSSCCSWCSWWCWGSWSGRGLLWCFNGMLLLLLVIYLR